MKNIIVTLVVGLVSVLNVNAKEGNLKMVGGDDISVSISTIKQIRNQIQFGNKATLEIDKKSKSIRVVKGRTLTQYKCKSITTYKRLKSIKYVLLDNESVNSSKTIYLMRSKSLLVGVVNK